MFCSRNWRFNIWFWAQIVLVVLFSATWVVWRYDWRIKSGAGVGDYLLFNCVLLAGPPALQLVQAWSLS